MASVQPTTTTIRAPNPIAPFPRGTTQITQASLAEQPILPPGVIHRLTFSSETVKRLTTEDFDLGSKELVALKYDDCILVLFHVENTESYQLADIWALVAQQVAGPVFAAINMLSERKVAEAFTRLKSDGSNPLHWASLRQFPFIMVYRKRWPVAIYNGPREVQAIIDYSLTLACEAGYYEILQVGGSMQAEARIEMGPYNVYTNIPGSPPRVRKDSIEYSSEQPVRGFNPNIPIEITGSAGARAATGQIRAEELQQQAAAAGGAQTSLTTSFEAPPAINQITGEPNVTASAQIPPAAVANPAVAQPQLPAPAQVNAQATPAFAVPAVLGTPAP